MDDVDSDRGVVDIVHTGQGIASNGQREGGLAEEVIGRRGYRVSGMVVGREDRCWICIRGVVRYLSS